MICFSGGNTLYLLEKIQESGCLKIIRDLVLNGMIFIGISAGSEIASTNVYSVYTPDDFKDEVGV